VGAKDFNIDDSTLITSILAAFAHAVIECFVFYLESRACKQKFINYGVICLNGRLNWVPFIEFFRFENPNIGS
jgi:hypothetical protein